VGLDLHDWAFHGFRLTTPTSGGGEQSVIPLLEEFLNSTTPLPESTSRRYEKSFGRVVSTEQELAAAYLQMVNELANVARSVLGEQRT
jgi:hypothetical protein